jgi:hypothetical protein
MQCQVCRLRHGLHETSLALLQMLPRCTATRLTTLHHGQTPATLLDPRDCLLAATPTLNQPSLRHRRPMRKGNSRNRSRALDISSPVPLAPTKVKAAVGRCHHKTSRNTHNHNSSINSQKPSSSALVATSAQALLVASEIVSWVDRLLEEHPTSQNRPMYSRRGTGSILQLACVILSLTTHNSLVQAWNPPAGHPLASRARIQMCRLHRTVPTSVPHDASPYSLPAGA